MREINWRNIASFQRAIGRFVLSWADLELRLDLLALTIRLIESPDQRASALPHQLKDKLRYVRGKVEALEALQEHRTGIIEILDQIKDLSDTRHDFVHGAAIEYHTGSSTTVTLARLLQPSIGPRRKPTKVTVGQVNATSDRVRSLGGNLLDFAETINRTNQAPMKH